jgi:hypothetical protein
MPYRIRAALACLVLIVCTLAGACARKPTAASLGQAAPAILLPTAIAGIADGRGRFREIYNAVREDHGASLPFDRPADGNTALWQLPGEPPATGRPVALGRSTAGFTVLMVPGLLAECVAEKSRMFEDATADLEAFGYRTGFVQTRGRQCSDTNADIVRDAVMAVPGDAAIILATHSKGTVDSLEALAKYPELAARVKAVISFSGAVNGSPVADAFPDFLARLIEHMHMDSCPPGREVEALDSLRPRARLTWLATHELPKSVRYYSLAAFAAPEDISAILRPFYNFLAATEPLNDSLVACSDAIIPGSTLLGYPNADHLAVAMPFGAKSPLLKATLINRNDYPRAVLLEAAVRYVEEDLGDQRGAAPLESPPGGMMPPGPPQ